MAGRSFVGDETSVKRVVPPVRVSPSIPAVMRAASTPIEALMVPVIPGKGLSHPIERPAPSPTALPNKAALTVACPLFGLVTSGVRLKIPTKPRR